MPSNTLSDSEHMALQELSRLFGVREPAIRHFLHIAESNLDCPDTFQELLAAVKKLRERPPGILMPWDEHILEAFAEMQGEEFGTKWHLSPCEISMLGPNILMGEAWLDEERIESIEHDFREHLGAVDLRRLNPYRHRCWKEIMANRQYAVPSNGRAEVLASENLAVLLGLKSIRFLQEGVRAPGVFLRLEFQEPRAVGIIKIQPNGTIQWFTKAIRLKRLRGLIEAVAVAYYRDLVTPDDIYLYQPYRVQKGRKTKHQRSSRPRQKQPRKLPRQQIIAIASSKAFELSEWYFAQERARHSVVGHMRWEGRYFKADDEKRLQALKSGVRLKDGYTWVIEHERGSGDEGGLRLDNYDLVGHTVFAAPRRATKDLQELLFNS